jgi:guanine deaminase
MIRALDLSLESVREGGGPFGALIVRNGRVIAVGMNTVTPESDPTAHAEINAIRNASRKLKSHDLSGCEIYCSCEPCPMCLGAIYWARIERIFYANSMQEAEKFGFDDSEISREFVKPVRERSIPAVHVHVDKALEAFQYWDRLQDKTPY